MGTCGLEGVIRAWERGDLTTEQAIGQILLLLQELEERIKSIERGLEWHRAQTERVVAGL